MGRKRTGMRRLQNQMLGIVQHLFLGLGRTPPQDENHGSVLLVQRPDSGVRKLLPSLPAVGIGHMGPNRQHRIEHQHTLLRPLHQIAVVGNIAAHIVMKLLIDINKRRRRSYLRLHGKAEPMGLPYIVVGILP